MVEVFKTNVATVELANGLIQQLLQHWPEAIITFDLEDCDKVLRFEARDFDPGLICSLLHDAGSACDVMTIRN